MAWPASVTCRRKDADVVLTSSAQLVSRSRCTSTYCCTNSM